jgi:hypothetical protein
VAGLPQVVAFISYSHVDKRYAGQTRSVLAEVGIEAFLAHEDLEISAEWRTRIIEELARCDLFVPLLSSNFLASKWAPQEVGYIISRPNVVIVPISIDGTIPFGFMSHVQSRPISSDGVTRELLVEPLVKRFPRKIVPGLIRTVGEAPNFRGAEARMRPLVPLFGLFTADEAQALAEAAVGNGQVWSAHRCRTEYLPEFIRLQGHNIAPDTLHALHYQIEHDRSFPRKPEP